MRLNYILAKKITRDIKRNVIQYVAIILIAALAISLFLGLASSYHTLNDRVQQLYKAGSVADLFLSSTNFTEQDYAQIKNLDEMKGAQCERRTLLPVNISVKKDSTQDASGWLDDNYNLILNHHTYTINRITDYYDHTGKNISDEFPNLALDDGLYLPRAYKSVPLGSNLDIKIAYSFLTNLLTMRGLSFEIVDGEYTGKILHNKNYLTLSLGTFTFDFSKEAFATINAYIPPADIKGEGAQKEQNNLLSFNNYLALIKKINNPDSFLTLNLKLKAYVDTPEVINKNEQQKHAFINRSLFLNALQNTLANTYQNEVALFSFLLANIGNKPVNDYQNVLSNYYEPSFFTSGFAATIKTGYAILTLEQKKQVQTNLLKFALYKEKVNNYYNQIVIRLQDNKNITLLQENINTLPLSSPLILNQTLAQSESNKTIQADVIQSRQLMLVFPVIFFVVAFLIIISTAIQMVIKERVQIGTLKALGIGNYIIYRHYIMRNLLIITIGVLIGIFTGPFALPYVVNQKYKLLYNLPRLRIVFPWLEMLTLLVIFYSLVSLIIFFIIRSEIKLSPAKSMRPKAPEVSFKTEPSKIKANHIPRKMAMRNIRINKFRSLMTVIGVFGCVALLLVGLGISDTLDYGINHDMNIYNRCDMTVAYKLGNNIAPQIKTMPEVKKYEIFFSFPANLKNLRNNKTTQALSMAYLSNSSFYQPPSQEKIAFGQCNISAKVAKILALKEGDIVSFTTIDNREFSFTINKVIKTFFVQGIIFNYDDPKVGNLDMLAQLCYIDLYDNSPSKVAAFEQKLMQMPEIARVITKKETARIINDVMATVKVATYTILFFAITLAIVVLYNLAQLNLSARKRELATLKVLGFKDKEITSSLVYEILFLTIIGIIIGLLLGLPTLYLILRINETPIISYLYHLTWESYILAGSAVLLTTFLLTQYIAVKNKKIDMISMLKSVE